MASWNIPALINKISEDVPAIKALLTALFKWTDAGTEDVPEGAKRLQSVTGGRQIQEYSGSSWGSVGKLMHDVDMLDGKHASTAQTPDTIPVRDANGSIPGNITGNAATATTASSVSNEYVVPIANGGTGATSAANARTNLGTNNAENITQGVLATARGGTGRNDGKVTDVFLTDYQTGAVGLGQLGQAVTKNAVDCDTLTRQGKFYCTGCTLALHYPPAGDMALEVVHNGSIIVQKAVSGDALQHWTRVSRDNGASWLNWILDKYNVDNNVGIYISKGGSDANTGLSSNAPVLTWGRAFQIAKKVSSNGTLVFLCGPGEWGDVSIYMSDFTCANVCVTNYVDSQKNTIADFEALTDSGNTGNQPPHFTQLQVVDGNVFLGNINVDFIYYNNTCNFNGNNCFKFGGMSITNGYFDHRADLIVNKVSGVTAPVFTLVQSYLYIDSAVTCKFVNSPTNTHFIATHGASSIAIANGFSTSGEFQGTKYIFIYPPVINGYTIQPYNWPGIIPSEGISGTYFYGSLPYVTGNLKLSCGTLKGTVTSGTQYFPMVELFEKRTYTGYETQEHRIALLEGSYNPNGATHVYIGAYRNEAGTSDLALLSIVCEANGTKYAICPTPAYGDNNTKIATTNWVRNATGNTSLNAATATKLANARTIFGLNFDGSNNVSGICSATSLELTGISQHNHGGYIDFHFNDPTANYTTRLIEDAKGLLTLAGTLHISNGTDKIADLYIHRGAKSFFFRNDGTNFYLLKTADNDPVGYWNGDTIPLIVYGDTGICNINGNAATATKSNTADTPAGDDNSTRTATTAWVYNRLGNNAYGMVPSGNWQERSNGVTYTAECNGWVYARNSKYRSCGQNANINVNGVVYWMQNTSYGSGSCNPDNVVIAPVRKGWYYIPTSLDSCGWIPAV